MPTKIEKQLNQVHYIAEKFLKDPWAKEPDVLTTEFITDTTSKVILLRSEIPEYFVGLKGGFRPVWSHDAKLAKQFSLSEAQGWVDNLAVMGITVLQRWSDATEDYQIRPLVKP